jgi:membrane dipeptidase
MGSVKIIHLLAMIDYPPIVDLHCDLLAYLSDVEGATPIDDNDDIGCSLPKLYEGYVALQTMAIYSATGPESVASGIKQSDIFASMMEEYPDLVVAFDDTNDILSDGRTVCIAAIENASGFCDEHQSLDDGFNQLEYIREQTGSLLYISMTHDHENRFGGGNTTAIGLKPDGEVLLDYLDGQCIAIDLAHTSDALAYDILKYIDSKHLDIPVMASHSNMRSVQNHARNLPDELVQEIIRREGIIGINFYREFVAPDNPWALIEHIQYALDQGGERAVCFGTDYFFNPNGEDFFLEFGDSRTIQVLVGELYDCLEENQVTRLCYGNALEFIQRVIP